jgi:hypothetical protein
MENVLTGVAVITAGALLVTSCSAGVGRYIVTASPIDIGAVRQRLCIAVDPSTSDGVWWWEPGRSGCRTRSTGPTVFHADGASVVRTSNTIDVRFRLQLIVADPQKQRSFADVLLTIDRHTFRCSSTGTEVQAARLRRLDVPEQVP